MRIGIYGGTFNPPHIGHLHVADTARQRYGLDKVIFVPAGDPYMKEKAELASAWNRLSMTNLAVKGSLDDHFYVSPTEYEREKPSYTIDTLRYFKKVFPLDDLFLIVGEDAFRQIPKWKESDEIQNLAEIIVIERTINISSTMIREMIRHGDSCRYLLPYQVYDYILNHKLYKDLENMT